MLTENGMDIDGDALEEVLSQADVLTVGFTLFPQRLLIDTRSNDETGPLVRIVAPVASVQERYLWLGKYRGALGAPQGFSFFVWPQTVRGLIERDGLRTMRGRLEAAPGDGVGQLDRALAELRKLEEEEFRRAIRGEGHWRSLWQSQGIGD